MEYFLIVIILVIIVYCCYQSWKHKPRNEAKEYSNMWEWWGEENRRKDKEGD